MRCQSFLAAFACLLALGWAGSAAKAALPPAPGTPAHSTNAPLAPYSVKEDEAWRAALKDLTRSHRQWNGHTLGCAHLYWSVDNAPTLLLCYPPEEKGGTGHRLIWKWMDGETVLVFGGPSGGA